MRLQVLSRDLMVLRSSNFYNSAALSRWHDGFRVVSDKATHGKLSHLSPTQSHGLFGWLVADGWCWFVLREEYCWLVLAGCWWLVCSERKVLLAGG
jgi:hypothetical protein